MKSRHSLSVLLSAICILEFSRIALASDVLVCELPQELTLQVTKDRRALLHESTIIVRFDNDTFTVTPYEGTNAVNIQGSNVEVYFSGFTYVEPEHSTKGNSIEENSTEENLTEENSTPWTSMDETVVISRTFIDRISGIAQREVLDSSDIEGCRVILLSTEVDRPESGGRIANEIRRLAESCIERELCQKFGAMELQSVATPTSKSVSDLILACPKPDDENTKNCTTYYNNENVQPIINKILDFALDQATDKLREMNNGTFDIPSVEQGFSTGASIFKTNGKLKTGEGTFRDLTTTRRKSDVTLSHDGLKVMIACEFGLDIAHVNYPNYELKYGIIKVSGNMAGSVNNAAIVIQMAADYNSKPCNLSMEYLIVTKLGEIDIELTGLGPLNWMASSILNKVIVTWRQEIVMALENELPALVNEQLASFDCEEYRP